MRTCRLCCSWCRPRSSSGGSSSGAARPGPTARARRPSCRRGLQWPCRRGASALLAKVRRVIVLELDLDAFEGPFDLLLTLVLKEELDLADVDVAGIVLGFVERLAEREELDL